MIQNSLGSSACGFCHSYHFTSTSEEEPVAVEEERGTLSCVLNSPGSKAVNFPLGLMRSPTVHGTIAPLTTMNKLSFIDKYRQSQRHDEEQERAAPDAGITSILHLQPYILNNMKACILGLQ